VILLSLLCILFFPSLEKPSEIFRPETPKVSTSTTKAEKVTDTKPKPARETPKEPKPTAKRKETTTSVEDKKKPNLKVDWTESDAKKQKIASKIGPKYVPFDRLFSDVVFVLSGFENPYRYNWLRCAGRKEGRKERKEGKKENNIFQIPTSRKGAGNGCPVSARLEAKSLHPFGVCLSRYPKIQPRSGL